MSEKMWCLMAKVNMNWPFVPIDHLKQCLIFLGTALIAMRTANSSPHTFSDAFWELPIASLQPSATGWPFPCFVRQPPLAQKGSRWDFGCLPLQRYWLSTDGEGRACCKELPFLSSVSTDKLSSCHSVGKWDCSPHTRQPSPTSPAHHGSPQPCIKGGYNTARNCSRYIESRSEKPSKVTKSSH